MNATTILPCPFCGQQPTEYAIEPHTHVLQFAGGKMPDHQGSHVIECACGCGMIEATREAVAAVWNRRPTPAAVAVPDGYALVPVNPTAEMCKAANWSSSNRQRWADMLAAAPALAATPADHIADAGKMVAAPAGWKLVPVQVPDSAFPWVSGGYSTDYRAHDPREQKIIEDRAQRTWEAILDGIAATPAAAPDMVSVKKDDANNYCRILTALDMEEEGDPVMEVQNLLAASVAQDAVTQAVRDYYFALDTHQHGGVAASTALDAIQKAFGLNWVQGAEASARAAAEGK